MSDTASVSNNFSSDAIQYSKETAYYGLGSGGGGGGGSAVIITPPSAVLGQFQTGATVPSGSTGWELAVQPGVTGSQASFFTNTVSNLFPTNTNTFNGVLQFQLGLPDPTQASQSEVAYIAGVTATFEPYRTALVITLEDTAGHVLGSTPLFTSVWVDVSVGKVGTDYRWKPQLVSGSMYVNATGSGCGINPDVRLKFTIVEGCGAGSLDTTGFQKWNTSTQFQVALSGRIYAS